MKKIFIRLTLFVAASVLVILFIPDSTAKPKKKHVTLSTVDIDKDYKILGLVSYRSSELSPKKVQKELRKQAEKMGADYVVGITFYDNAGYLYGTGTAVKLIKEDKSKK